MRAELAQKLETNRTIKIEVEMPKMKKEAKKLKTKIKKNFRRGRQEMESELKQVEEEKEQRYSEMMNCGDKLTEMMDEDRMKYFVKNKKLKELKAKTDGLQETIKDLDRQIIPVDRRFK